MGQLGEQTHRSSGASSTRRRPGAMVWAVLQRSPSQQLISAAITPSTLAPKHICLEAQPFMVVLMPSESTTDENVSVWVLTLQSIKGSLKRTLKLQHRWKRLFSGYLWQRCSSPHSPDSLKWHCTGFHHTGSTSYHWEWNQGHLWYRTRRQIEEAVEYTGDCSLIPRLSVHKRQTSLLTVNNHSWPLG